jgi:peroxiredoxin Q/BCP
MSDSAQSDSAWVGKSFPEFELPDQEGKVHRLKDYAGKFLVVYTYPKDDTPGCTAEACGFRDNISELKALGAVVLGVSILDTNSKAKFAKKYNLNFPLLADPDAVFLNQIGVWKEKSMYGKTYMGVSRETFIVGPDGKVRAHWPTAKGSEEHSQEIITWLKQNRGG